MLTPLMAAARTNSKEVVDLLLGRKANPNTVVLINKYGIRKDASSSKEDDDEEYTALIFAIESGNPQIVAKLLEVTEIQLKNAFNKLAESTIDWKHHREEFNRLKHTIKIKIEKDKDLFKIFFESAAIHGSRTWISFLRLEYPNLVKELSKETRERVLEDVTYSDDAEAVQELINDQHFPVTEKIKSIAKSCGRTEVIKVLLGETVAGVEEVSENRIFNDAIKSKEFSYSDNIGKLINEFLSNRGSIGRIVVKMNDLVKKMKTLPVHYNNEERQYSLDEEDCPDSCNQKRICLRIRQTLQLITDILNKIGEKYPLFKNPEMIIVGSLKEGTKIGFIDEADVALLLNKKYDKGYFEFDERRQSVKLSWPWSKSQLPKELEEFVKDDGIFDCTRYFQIFVEETHKVIKEKSVKLPKGLSLSVKFHPCDICRNDEDIVTQYVRCRHEPNCQEHKKTKDDPAYKEKCHCTVYNLPSLTYSKIGIVLHLVYQEDDKPFIIDVDVNPPTIPVKNVKYFNGSNKMKRLWLKKNRHRIRNWRAEWRKSHDMSAAGRVYVTDHRGHRVEDESGNYVLVGIRSVRLRMVNRNLVIPKTIL